MTRRAILTVVAAATCLAAAACTPTPGGGGTTTTSTTSTTISTPTPPSIVSFAPSPGAGTGEAPALLTLSWQVTDPNGDAVLCRIDSNGDGFVDLLIPNCQKPGSRNVAFATSGTFTATIEASDGNQPPVTASTVLTVTPETVSSAYSITVRPVSPLSAPVLAAFTNAAAAWSAAITRSVPDIDVNLPAGFCLAGSAPLSGTIHNLVIDVDVSAIDGSGGILGQAGPCWAANVDSLTRVGDMQFDSADVTNMLNGGTFGDVVLHEMGHVLGVGTLWDFNRSLLSGSVAGGGSDPRYVGPRGAAEYSKLGGGTTVPVEAGGGPGTQDSHWRESTFGNELMTGYISGAPNPMSALTIASLGDLGYHVDTTRADAYVLPGPPALRSAATAAALPPMVLHGPKGSS